MLGSSNCVDRLTTINNVDYVLQSRTIAAADGSENHQYRVMLNGTVIKSWTPGDISAYFSIADSSTP